jgi:hypothetical protein
MKTSSLIALLGTKTALAAWVGLSKQSISAWGETVPLLRQYQIREMHPDIDERLAQVEQQKHAEAA